MVDIKESDRYFTPSWIVDAVIEQFGVIDLDPCHDPDPSCVVKATTTFDIRKGEDGLVLPWRGNNVYLNPPYSAGHVLPFLLRAAQHAMTGGEVLALINVASDTRAFQDVALRHGEVCLLNKRVGFLKPGSAKPTANLQPSAIVHP